jgi:hypothetical protein
MTDQNERLYYARQEERRDKMRFWTNVVEISLQDSTPFTESIRLADACLDAYEKRFPDVTHELLEATKDGEK